MTVSHHLTDALLMAYSAGTLPEAFGVVVATHITLCDDCRARLGSFDAIGGAVLAACDSVEMAEGSFAATLQRIASAPHPTAIRPAPSALPMPLHDYVSGDLANAKWRYIGMGVRQAVLPTHKSARLRLLYIPGGVTLPQHSHGGLELTLVLQGAFRDQTDRFGPGDVETADETVQHTPVAEDGAPCICLAATDAPLRFNRLIPRIAQSLFRI